jgi:deoxyribodipyrimidine photo-lyase
VWDLKQRLEGLNCGSGLEMRVGRVDEVVSDILESYAQLDGNAGSTPKISGVWLTDDDGTEEKDEVRAVEKVAAKYNIPFKAWADEKFYIDECVIFHILPPARTHLGSLT